jgi:hypothetical protein
MREILYITRIIHKPLSLSILKHKDYKPFGFNYYNFCAFYYETLWHAIFGCAQNRIPNEKVQIY